MKRTLYTVLLIVAAFIGLSHLKQAQKEQKIEISSEQVEWLNKRLALEASIRDVEKKLSNLIARYNAIPDGAAYHTPWFSLSEIQTHIKKLEQDFRFSKSCKCEKVSKETQIFCRDWQRAKSDQSRWYALVKLAAEINATKHELAMLRIEAGQMGDNVPEAKRELMKFMREA